MGNSCAGTASHADVRRRASPPALCNPSCLLLHLPLPQCQASADGRTALHYATGHPYWNHSLELLDLLLDAGADAEASTTAPLNNAALRGAGERLCMLSRLDSAPVLLINRAIPFALLLRRR